MNRNLLSYAIELTGGGPTPIATACGVTYQAIRKWEKAARLPRSEHVGATDYATAISRLVSGAITVEQLRAWSLAGWQRGKRLKNAA